MCHLRLVQLLLARFCARSSGPDQGRASIRYEIALQGQESTLTFGSSTALGISKDGPMRLPRALVPTHTASRLAGSDDGILTSPYDLTFMQVTCKQVSYV